MGPLPLRAAVKRGALVTAANWPVVLIDFAVESFYKLALAVPILGGALMVATILGTDVQLLVGEGVRATADLVIGSLATTPVALAAFLLALAIVAIGGEAVMSAIKAGTFAVLVRGERALADAPRVAGEDALERAEAFSLAIVLANARRFAGRSLRLVAALAAGYIAVGGTYLVGMSYSFTLTAGAAWTPAWPLLVLGATTVAVLVVSAINIAYDLLRVIIITDDCGIRDAARRLRRFVAADARQVFGILCVLAAVVVLATVAAVLAAAGLTIVPWLRYAGLAVVPLQAAAWVLRQVLFEFMALSALAAYQTQYRRFETDAPRG